MSKPLSKIPSFGSVRSGVIAGGLAPLVQTGLRFVWTPVIVATVGLDAYAFWSLSFLLLGMLGLHKAGLLAGAIPLVARHAARDDAEELAETVRASSWCGAALWLIVGGIVALLAGPLVDLIASSESLSAEMATCLLWLVAGLGPTLALTGCQAFLEGLQRQGEVRIIECLGTVLEGIILVSMLLTGWGIIAFGVAHVARSVLVAALLLVRCARLHPLRSLVRPPMRRGSCRAILDLGSRLHLISCVQVAAASIDRFFLAGVASLEACGAYEIARKAASLVTLVPASALGPLVPAAAIDDARSDSPTARTRLAVQTLMLVVAVPTAVIALFPEAMIVFWVGEAPALAAAALPWLVMASLLHLSTGPLTAAARGAARPGAEMQAAFVWALVAVLGLLVFGDGAHPVSVAIVASAAQALGALAAWVLLAREVGRSAPSVLFGGLAVIGCSAACVLAFTAQEMGVPASRLEAITWLAVAWLIGMTPVVLMLLRARGGLPMKADRRPVS